MYPSTHEAYGWGTPLSISLSAIDAGAAMVPISWTEMQCPVTGQVEQRKVAKVD